VINERRQEINERMEELSDEVGKKGSGSIAICNCHFGCEM